MSSEEFAEFLARAHGLTPDDVVLTDSPGFWEITHLCGGRGGGCRAPIHDFLFNEGSMRHTVYFDDPIRRDERGRWLPHHRFWQVERAKRGVVTDDAVR